MVIYGEGIGARPEQLPDVQLHCAGAGGRNLGLNSSSELGGGSRASHPPATASAGSG